MLRTMRVVVVVMVIVMIMGSDYHRNDVIDVYAEG